MSQPGYLSTQLQKPRSLESSEEIKHYLRELVHSVEVVSEDVTIRYAFNSTDTKVAYQLAPRVGFEPTT